MYVECALEQRKYVFKLDELHTVYGNCMKQIEYYISIASTILKGELTYYFQEYGS